MRFRLFLVPTYEGKRNFITLLWTEDAITLYHLSVITSYIDGNGHKIEVIEQANIRCSGYSRFRWSRVSNVALTCCERAT